MPVIYILQHTEDEIIIKLSVRNNGNVNIRKYIENFQLFYSSSL